MFHKPNSSTLGGKKDAPLRKSDRRKLRDRLIETLFIGEGSGEWISRAEKLIEDAIVAPKGGDVMCRKLKLVGGDHATLFLRSSGGEISGAAVVMETPNNLEELMKSYPTSWPYQTTQPILLEYEDSDRKLHLIPLLSLLAALPPPPSTPLLAGALEPQAEYTSNASARKYRIPSILVHPQVSKYICRGADLMKSGIRSFPPPWEIRQSKGVVTISIIGNPQPLAVGMIEKGLLREYCYKNGQKGNANWREDACNLVGPSKKGVGVTIVSCYGDDLWKSSLPSKSSLKTGLRNPLGGGVYDDGNHGNVGFQDGSLACPILAVAEEDLSSDDDEEEGAAETIFPGEALDIEQLNIYDKSDDTDQVKKPSSDVPLNDKQDDETPEVDHDAILHAAFYTSLLQLLASKTPLPMPVSTYSAKYLMAAIPQSGPRLDLKQTTHKKIGPFLIDMESQGVIKIGPSKDKKDRCAFLVCIEKQHPDLIAFNRHWKKEMEQSGQDPTMMTGGDNKKKLAVVDLFIVPRHISDGLQLKQDDVKALNAKTEERKGTGFLTKTECRAIIDAYIESEGLVDPNSKGKVIVNGPLCDALYRPSKMNKDQENTSFPTSVSRKDLIDKWCSKMDVGHALVEMPGSNILNLSRGEPKPVDIEVEFRQGNKKKFLTRLRGMEEYGVEAEALSNDVSQRFACSSSVETNPVGRPALKKGRAELVFQGEVFRFSA
jgi:translation initiation factor 2D